MDIKKEIERLSPWHYCHIIKGHSTGDCTQEQTHPKLQELINCGVFSRPVYPNVLDLGANSGIIAEWFIKNKSSVVDAVEAGPKYYPQLEFVVKHKELEGLIIPINENIVDYKFPYMKYDLVLYLGTMHHIPQEYHKQVLKFCYYSLIPGGEIVVQTKLDLRVPELMKQVKFLDVKRIEGTSWNDRAAWTGFKDPMKII